MTLIVQSYLDTLLRYVSSVAFCGAAVMKVMDQKTLVKRRWSYKVHITVYIVTLSEFARHKSLIGNLARHPFSSLDRNKTRPQTSKKSKWFKGYLIASRTMDDYRNSPIIKFCADLFPAHRCSFAIKFKIRLECAIVNWSNVVLFCKAYFPANKMN